MQTSLIVYFNKYLFVYPNELFAPHILPSLSCLVLLCQRLGGART